MLAVNNSSEAQLPQTVSVTDSSDGCIDSAYGAKPPTLNAVDACSLLTAAFQVGTLFEGGLVCSLLAAASTEGLHIAAKATAVSSWP